MGYHVFETPDHLHRGLHLFAVHNLNRLVSWLRVELELRIRKSQSIFQPIHFSDKWFLEQAIHNVSMTSRGPNWLAKKDAQAFLKQHPEFRQRSSNKVWHGPEPPTSRAEEEYFIRDAAERQEFEVYAEFKDWPEIIHAIEALNHSVSNAKVSSICDRISDLQEVLAESDFPDWLVGRALGSINELLSEGVRQDARLLVTDENEAYEVTKLCGGAFRKWAALNIGEIRTLHPLQFEALCAELLAQHGLQNVKTTAIVADGGVDIVAAQFVDDKRLKYIVQCKRYAAQNRIDVSVVRELVGVKMDSGAATALLMTTSELTRPARDFVKRNRCQPWGIRVIDFRLLARLLQMTD